VVSVLDAVLQEIVESIGLRDVAMGCIPARFLPSV